MRRQSAVLAAVQAVLAERFLNTPTPRTMTLGKDAVAAAGDGFTITLPDNVLTEADVKANFVPKAEHTRLTETVQERVNKAAENAGKVARDEAAKDEKWLTELAKSRKDFFAPLFPGKGEVDLDRIRDQFRAEEVEPLKAQLGQVDTELKSLRTQAVNGSVESALAEAGVMDESRDLMRDHLLMRMQYSAEHGQVVVMEITDKGPQVMQKVDKGTMRPLKPAEYLQTLKQGGKHGSHFKAAQSGGAGFNGAGGSDPGDLDAQIRDAEGKGNFALAGQLKAQKLAKLR